MSERNREAEIIDAVERIVSRSGIHAVSMRAIAAEAGVSLRLVQYYGKTKSDLLNTALRHMSEQSVRRWRESIDENNMTPRQVLETFVDIAVPHDEASLAFHRLGVSLEQLAIIDSDWADDFYSDHLKQLATLIVPHIQRFTGTARSDLAYELIGLTHGLGSLVATRVIDEGQVRKITSRYLDRIAGDS